jgi:phage terminase large subunit
MLAEIDKRKWRSVPVSAAYADSARPDLNQLFQDLTGIVTEGADKDVDAGISTVGNLFDKCRINIMRNCEYLIKELRTYQRMVDKDGNTTDKPEKKHDDSPDALRYAMHTYNPGNKGWDKYDNAVTG